MREISPTRNLKDELDIKPSDVNKFCNLFFDKNFDEIFKILNKKNKKGELKIRYFNNFMNLLNDIIGIIPNGMSLYKTITKKKNNKTYKTLDFLFNLSTLIFFDTQNITSFKNLNELKETFLNTFYFLKVLLDSEALLKEVNTITKGQCYISDMIDELLNYFVKFIDSNIKDSKDKITSSNTNSDKKINNYKLKNNVNLFVSDFKQFVKEQLSELRKKEKLSNSEEQDILIYKNINNILNKYKKHISDSN